MNLRNQAAPAAPLPVALPAAQAASARLVTNPADPQDHNVGQTATCGPGHRGLLTGHAPRNVPTATRASVQVQPLTIQSSGGNRVQVSGCAYRSGVIWTRRPAVEASRLHLAGPVGLVRGLPAPARRALAAGIGGT